MEQKYMLERWMGGKATKLILGNPRLFRLEEKIIRRGVKY